MFEVIGEPRKECKKAGEQSGAELLSEGGVIHGIGLLT
ncbi:hypothetical protein SAMN05444972_11164 [Marininema halotolerans]|uniref:Uncharacterized protein n=1 Tax=Marininema halotolerans TaxID=1155944 RepID=A0A1I6TTK1_9BACL|nr:hypothetical protein SAMN05444972_11164 [Marininema halotolerans]